MFCARQQQQQQQLQLQHTSFSLSAGSERRQKCEVVALTMPEKPYPYEKYRIRHEISNHEGEESCEPLRAPIFVLQRMLLQDLPSCWLLLARRGACQRSGDVRAGEYNHQKARHKVPP